MEWQQSVSFARRRLLSPSVSHQRWYSSPMRIIAQWVPSPSECPPVSLSSADSRASNHRVILITLDTQWPWESPSNAIHHPVSHGHAVRVHVPRCSSLGVCVRLCQSMLVCMTLWHSVILCDLQWSCVHQWWVPKWVFLWQDTIHHDSHVLASDVLWWIASGCIVECDMMWLCLCLCLCFGENENENENESESESESERRVSVHKWWISDLKWVITHDSHCQSWCDWLIDWLRGDEWLSVWVSECLLTLHIWILIKTLYIWILVWLFIFGFWLRLFIFGF